MVFCGDLKSGFGIGSVKVWEGRCLGWILD